MKGTPQNEQNSGGTTQVGGWEAFFGSYQHSIAALEAFATVAAVVLSLAFALMAQRATRTRAKAFAQIVTMHHVTLGDSRPAYVTVYIRNAGLNSLMIPFSFFYWRMPFEWEKPFSQRGWSVVPWDYSQGDALVPQKHYPVEIKPRSAEDFFLADIETFRVGFREIFEGANFLERCRFRFLKGRILTVDGKLFPVKISRTLRKELRELLQSTSAIHKRRLPQ